ncbi:MAG: homoserine dehydrogenase [Actinomycetota bacterium]
MNERSDRVTTDGPVRVGLLGCGNVGGALVELLGERASAVAADAGLVLEVAGIAVRSTTKDRGLSVDPELLTTDAAALVDDPTVDVVVELIGGIEPARTLVLQALKQGKPVVTGNKELLANHGGELYAAAEAAGVDLLFESSAAGAIPIIRPLRESLLGEDIRSIMGIVNGTTNYILTRMTEEGVDYGEVLAEAQRLGYAERDPTADVEGYDAGAKAAIMASIAFGANVVAGDVYHEGIADITADDIEFARRFDYTIKLLAIAERHDGDGGQEIGVRVYPAMVPDSHPLASVRGSFNAVFVDGGAAGELMFYGRGAGGMPTASAVLGDLIDAATNLRRGTFRPVPSGPRATIRPIDDLETAYYVGLTVGDHPGVLSKVAGVFGRHDVSILAMQQEMSDPSTGAPSDDAGGETAKVAFITHVACERNIQATVSELRHLDEVTDIHSLLRVIG